MNKLRNYLVLGLLLLVLSWSDLSKFCRHQMINLKFRTAALKASLMPPVPDTVAYRDTTRYLMPYDPVADETPLHGEGMYTGEPDPAVLAAAVVRMDRSDTPVPLTWETLKDTRYKKKYNKTHDQYFDYPLFGEKVKAVDGQKVSIKGYIIPLDIDVYALSKNPYASCFFCGGAGPETVIDLTFAKPPRRLKTDEFITVQGVFRLNDQDVSRFMYQLYAVSIVKP